MGQHLCEAPGWSPDVQGWISTLEKGTICSARRVCSPRSEIKRQAELGVCKGQFGESVKKWPWGHRLPDQVWSLSWAVLSPWGWLWGWGGLFQRCCCINLCRGFGWGECAGSWKLVIAWPNVSVPRQRGGWDPRNGTGGWMSLALLRGGWPSNPALHLVRLLIPFSQQRSKAWSPTLCFSCGEELCFDKIHLKCWKLPFFHPFTFEMI